MFSFLCIWSICMSQDLLIISFLCFTNSIWIYSKYTTVFLKVLTLLFLHNEPFWTNTLTLSKLHTLVAKESSLFFLISQNSGFNWPLCSHLFLTIKPVSLRCLWERYESLVSAKLFHDRCSFFFLKIASVWEKIEGIFGLSRIKCCA